MLEFQRREGLRWSFLGLLLIDLGQKDYTVHDLIGLTRHSFRSDCLLVSELVRYVSSWEVIRVSVLYWQFGLIRVPLK